MKKRLLPLVGIALGTIIAWTSVTRLEALIYFAFPVTRWFEVRSLSVSDARPGESPLIRVDRVIHRPFSANWTVTLRRQRGGGFTVVCTRHGRSDYLPGSTLPEETNLNWWMAIPPNQPCREIQPGRYVVTIEWRVEADSLPPKAARIESNVFEVR